LARCGLLFQTSTCLKQHVSDCSLQLGPSPFDGAGDSLKSATRAVAEIMNAQESVGLDQVLCLWRLGSFDRVFPYFDGPVCSALDFWVHGLCLGYMVS